MDHRSGREPDRARAVAARPPGRHDRSRLPERLSVEAWAQAAAGSGEGAGPEPLGEASPAFQPPSTPVPALDRLEEVARGVLGGALEEVLAVDVTRHHALEDGEREFVQQYQLASGEADHCLSARALGAAHDRGGDPFWADDRP